MVYVDDMYKYEIGQFGRMKMSHMVADDRTELLIMAVVIGVNLNWIQKVDTKLEHFDVCIAKRKLAVEYGAKEITWRQLGEMVLSRK